MHSLEPLRPWKAEQLGGGYALSSFCERTALEGADAVIAVSEGMRATSSRAYPAIDPSSASRVIYNGIDADGVPRRTPGPTCSSGIGVDPARPSVVFVGRITRQKGVPYLVDAALEFDPEAPARALRGRAGHAGDRAPTSSGGSSGCAPSAGT